MQHAQTAVQAALDAFRQQCPGLSPEDIAGLMGSLEMLMQDCSQSNIQRYRIDKKTGTDALRF
ncbi:hypothetical protein DFQ27_005055 [Actinomortierella ambigua]|uniref:Uncharacterized protein n=1 Tax=Actinomortierella ambigua TaxID=1343610 RepID=A0A9P6U342_9FUNG|nr:hypothetical protein DFQ27_005055 [Actinomortierella ambigua]